MRVLTMEQSQAFGRQSVSLVPPRGSGLHWLLLDVSGQSPGFSSQPGPAELWLHLLGGPEKHIVLYSLEFPFLQRVFAFLLEMEGEYASQCLRLMKSGLNQTLKDLSYQRSSCIFVLGFLAVWHLFGAGSGDRPALVRCHHQWASSSAP